MRRARQIGEREARIQGQPRRSKLDPHRGYLLGLIEATPDLTISELLERLWTERDVKASLALPWTFLDRCGLTLKKRTAHASEQDRADVKERHEAWFALQPDFEPATLVFIDETWTHRLT